MFSKHHITLIDIVVLVSIFTILGCTPATAPTGGAAAPAETATTFSVNAGSYSLVLASTLSDSEQGNYTHLLVPISSVPQQFSGELSQSSDPNRVIIVAATYFDPIPTQALALVSNDTFGASQFTLSQSVSLTSKHILELKLATISNTDKPADLLFQFDQLGEAEVTGLARLENCPHCSGGDPRPRCRCWFCLCTERESVDRPLLSYECILPTGIDLPRDLPEGAVSPQGMSIEAGSVFLKAYTIDKGAMTSDAELLDLTANDKGELIIPEGYELNEPLLLPDNAEPPQAEPPQ